MAAERLSIVVVGDVNIGKSTLCAYLDGEYVDEQYVPTVVQSFSLDYNINGRCGLVNVYDTGHGLYEEMAIEDHYPIADCFLLCYSVVNPDSLYRLSSRLPVIQFHSKEGVPIIVCGTQLDLKNHYNYKGDYCSVKKAKKYVGKKVDIFEISTISEARRTGNYEGRISLMMNKCILEAFKFKYNIQDEKSANNNCVLC